MNEKINPISRILSLVQVNKIVHWVVGCMCPSPIIIPTFLTKEEKQGNSFKS